MRLFLPLASLVLAGCANRPPIVLPAQFDPPGYAMMATPPGAGCRVHIAQVRDMRADTQSMGEIGGRPIRAADSAAWVRSGLELMARNPRIVLAPEGEADLDLGADLIKGYVQSITTAKTANIVLRVSFKGLQATQDGKFYRGAEEGPNWAGTEDEAQGILNLALADALRDIQADILAQCGAVQKPGP